MCEHLRISHSHFLGGPDRWTDLDRAKALAFRAWKNGACPDCGTRAEEWDPKQGGHRHAYLADVKYCGGCSALTELRDNLEDSDRKAGVHLVLRPRAEYLAEEGLTDD